MCATRRITAAANKVQRLLHSNKPREAVEALSRVTDTVLLFRAFLRQPWCTSLLVNLKSFELFSDLNSQERRYLVSLCVRNNFLPWAS